MKKVLLIAVLMTISACAKQATVEEWWCSSPDINVEFIVDYENKTVRYGMDKVVRATINGGLIRFDLANEMTVKKTDKDNATFYLKSDKANLGVIARGTCERQK